MLRGLVVIFFRFFFWLYFFVFGKPEISINLKKTLNEYKDGVFGEFFSFIRVWDAPFEEINKIVPRRGNIIDLGCGEGILTNYLAISSVARKLIGIEIDKKRLKMANKNISNVSFKFGDITKVKIQKSDAIILSHVLHHLPSFELQVLVLKNCYQVLKDDGKLIIVEVSPKFSFKYFITLITDHFLVPILFENRLYSPIYFRKKTDWETLLKELGFTVDSKIVEKGKPFSHVLFIATKINNEKIN